MAGVSTDQHMKSWLEKLKETQDMRREEKLRRYNDVVTKVIIFLLAITIVSLVVVAAMIFQNDALNRDRNKIVAEYLSLNATNSQYIKNLEFEISTLEQNNQNLQNFIINNQTPNIDYTVLIDTTKYPQVKKITFNNKMVRIEFVDGTFLERYFVYYDLSV